MDYATGDAVIAMDADLQDPPEIIPQLLEKWLEGYDVVYAIREKRAETGFKKLAAHLGFAVSIVIFLYIVYALICKIILGTPGLINSNKKRGSL